MALETSFSSTSTTANAERFGTWNTNGNENKLVLLITCLSGTTTAADIRVSIDGKPGTIVRLEQQQTTRRILAVEWLAHELPPAGARVVRVYWPSATRLHAIGFGLSGRRQRYTPSGDIFAATSASATNANLTATAPTSNTDLVSAVWYGGTGTWSANSGQTTVGANNQQTTFASFGGYEAGVASGSQASDWSTSGGTAALGQLCLAIAEDTQGVSALDPADGATGVSTSPTLTLTMSETPSAGSGALRVYETDVPVTSAAVDAGETTSNTTNATSFSASLGSLGSLAGKRLILAIAHDGGASVLTDDGSPSPWRGAVRATGALIVWRDCDGSEGSTFDFTSTPGEGITCRAWAISGHDPDTPPVFALAEGNGTTPNPAAITFPWGTEPTLAIAWGRFDGGATVTSTNYPTGFTGTGTNTTSHATTGDRAAQGYAHQAGITAGSIDPSAFTISASELWTVFTIAIRPADPSVLVDTVAIGAATISGSDVEFAVTGLAAGTAHHAKLDAGAIVDYEGIYSRTAWNFETGAGGSDVEITAAEVRGDGRALAAGSPIFLAGGGAYGSGMAGGAATPIATGAAQVLGDGRSEALGTPVGVAFGGAFGAGRAEADGTPVTTGAAQVLGAGQVTGAGTPIGVASGAALGAGRVRASNEQNAEAAGQVRGGGHVGGLASSVFAAAARARGGGTIEAAGVPLFRAFGGALGGGRAVAVVTSIVGGAVRLRGAGRVRVSQLAKAPAPSGGLRGTLTIGARLGGTLVPGRRLTGRRVT